jgi:hypothetical protein
MLDMLLLHIREQNFVLPSTTKPVHQLAFGILEEPGASGCDADRPKS